MGKRREQSNQIDWEWLRRLENHVNGHEHLVARLRIEEQTIAILTLQAWWLGNREVQIPFVVTSNPRDTKTFELPAHGEMEPENALAFMIMQVCAAWHNSIKDSVSSSSKILLFLESKEAVEQLPEEMNAYLVTRWKILCGLVDNFNRKFGRQRFDSKIAKITKFKKQFNVVWRSLIANDASEEIGYSWITADHTTSSTAGYPANTAMHIAYQGVIADEETIDLMLFPSEKIVTGLHKKGKSAGIAPDSITGSANAKLVLLQLLQGDGIIAFAASGSSVYFVVNEEVVTELGLDQELLQELIKEFRVDLLLQLLEPHHMLYLQNRQVRIDTDRAVQKEKSARLAEPDSSSNVTFY